MEFDKYITIEDKELESPPIEELKKTSETTTKSTKSKRVKAAIELDNHDLTRKKDILASVAMLEGLKKYLGENITAVQIRNMKKEKLESYFLLYQEKAAQETTNSMMETLVELWIKGLSYGFTINNQEELKNDLLKNKELRRLIGSQAVGVTEKYGDVVSYMRILFDHYKHLSFLPGVEDSPAECQQNAGKSSTPNTLPAECQQNAGKSSTPN